MTPNRVLATEIACIFFGAIFGLVIGYLQWNLVKKALRKARAEQAAWEASAKIWKKLYDADEAALDLYRETAGGRLV